MTATVQHHRKKTTGFDIVIVILLIVLSAIFLYPLIVTLSTSISDPAVMNSRQVWLLPYGFSLEAYKTLLSGSEILQYYLNTILYAFCGTLIMLVCTAMLAYPLTYQTFALRKPLTALLLITMFFGSSANDWAHSSKSSLSLS